MLYRVLNNLFMMRELSAGKGFSKIWKNFSKKREDELGMLEKVKPIWCCHWVGVIGERGAKEK